MSRTRKGSKRPGYEYWGRRPCSGWNPGKESKMITRQIERAQEKEGLRDEIKEIENEVDDDGLQTGQQ